MLTAEEHGLSGADAALYDLIWKRTVASQMADAKLRFVTARIEARSAGTRATFRATGRTTVFPGFFRAYVEGSDDPDAVLDAQEQPLPALAPGHALQLEAVTPQGHETKPPARYTEASLVKLLEQEGIGRPSTYASIIDTIQRRRYVRKEGTQLIPTFVAFATTRLLEHQFRELVDTEFTATMEASLDEIAAGTIESIPYLRPSTPAPRASRSASARGSRASMRGRSAPIREEVWEPFVVRVGRYGPYVDGEIDGERSTASLPDDAAPADLTRDDLERMLREGNAGDVVIGTFPDSGEPMLLRRGPYGPYLQLGEGDNGDRPKRVSLPPGMTPEAVGEAEAQQLLSLPRLLGTHPDSGEPSRRASAASGPSCGTRRPSPASPRTRTYSPSRSSERSSCSRRSVPATSRCGSSASTRRPATRSR
jgi:DNA topoisomerase I